MTDNSGWKYNSPQINVENFSSLNQRKFSSVNNYYPAENDSKFKKSNEDMKKAITSLENFDLGNILKNINLSGPELNLNTDHNPGNKNRSHTVVYDNISHFDFTKINDVKRVSFDPYGLSEVLSLKPELEDRFELTTIGKKLRGVIIVFYI